MSETPNWVSPHPLIDFHDRPLPDDPDPARSFEVIGPAACRRVHDGAELYLSAGESDLLSSLGEGAITVEGLPDVLRHANRLAMAGLVEIEHGHLSALRLHPRATVQDLRDHVTDQVLTPPHAPRTMQQMQDDLQRNQYVLTNDTELKLSPVGYDAAGHIKAAYLNKLTTYPGDKPVDRRRLTGLMCAHWILDGLVVDPKGGQQQLVQRLVLQQSPYSTIPRFKNSNILKRPEEYEWHDLLHDPVCSKLCGDAMLLLPEESRTLSTTVGLQIFETFSDVVKGGHNDGGLLNVLYCISTDGGPDGAWTYVLDPDIPSAEGEMRFREYPLFACRLGKGDILLIVDNKVGHYSTPNTPRYPGHDPSRVMVVITVNRGWTYEEQLRYSYTDLLSRFQPTR